MVRKIIAMGGGGFSMEPENTLLDEFVRDATRKERPAICFVPTASHDAEGYIERFHRAFAQLGCETTDLRLWTAGNAEIGERIDAADAFYVGGGNTRDLLEKWRETGVAERLRAAYDAGKVMAGISAGSLCWFEAGVTDSYGGLSRLDGLGWLAGSNCVHYDGEVARRPAYRTLVKEGLPAGYACDDGVAVVFENEAFKQAVSSRPDARAYRVETHDETAIEPEFLGRNKALVVRRAGLEDIAGINAARQRSIREVCASHYTETQTTAWSRPIDASELAVRMKKDAYWVVTMSGRVEGFATLILSAEDEMVAEIKGLYLTPTATGRGLGKRLMTGVERQTLENKRRILRLKSTLNAVPFYESRGFVVAGAMESHERHGPPIAYVPMLKTLT